MYGNPMYGNGDFVTIPGAQPALAPQALVIKSENGYLVHWTVPPKVEKKDDEEPADLASLVGYQQAEAMGLPPNAPAIYATMRPARSVNYVSATRSGMIEAVRAALSVRGPVGAVERGFVAAWMPTAVVVSGVLDGEKVTGYIARLRERLPVLDTKVDESKPDEGRPEIAYLRTIGTVVGRLVANGPFGFAEKVYTFSDVDEVLAFLERTL